MSTDAEHGDDFRSVRWAGELYSFTPKQAEAVEILWHHWQRGTPDVGEAHLLTEIDGGRRLVDLFKRSPAWGSMIVRGERRGTRRLNVPKETF